MYYFKLISLKGCPYSQASEELFKNQKIKHELVQIDYTEKQKYKSDNITTFPQIYLKKKYSKGSVLVGGYDDIKEYFDLINESNTDVDKKILNFKNILNKKIPDISEKSILRLAELLNKN